VCEEQNVPTDLFADIDVARAAIIDADSGGVTTFGRLREQAYRFASLMRARGLRQGDHIAILLENRPEFLIAAWGAHVAGLIYTPISTRAPGPEATYIVVDCGARALVTSVRFAGVAGEVRANAPALDFGFMHDDAVGGFESIEAGLAGADSSTPPLSEAGRDMLYSSGTTGRPKGVLLTLPEVPFTAPTLVVPRLTMQYGFDDSTVYLSPAPLYHAAPIRFSMSTQYLGGTVVIMPSFDAERALELVQSYRVTAAQWVPTMFVRMLKLPEKVRNKYDVSSMRVAIHAAAPCPVEVKRQMLRWWGPIIHEYYAGTEGNGSTYCSPEDWLSHPGSVGRAMECTIHILDENGAEVPVGIDGTVYFDGHPFEYHQDPEKTRLARDRHGWSTLGDIGHLDADGFLYLTDRRAYTIIVGGVNVYPQEVEDLLLTHDKVMDAAVFGIPNDDTGEEVKAIIQLVDFDDACDELAKELLVLCRENLARAKVPRTLHFEPELPRMPTGKLLKRVLRDRYLSQSS
jgi:long-chain acyl-CoA synthetase